ADSSCGGEGSRPRWRQRSRPRSQEGPRPRSGEEEKRPRSRQGSRPRSPRQGSRPRSRQGPPRPRSREGPPRSRSREGSRQGSRRAGCGCRQGDGLGGAAAERRQCWVCGGMVPREGTDGGEEHLRQALGGMVCSNRAYHSSRAIGDRREEKPSQQDREAAPPQKKKADRLTAHRPCTGHGQEGASPAPAWGGGRGRRARQ
ncbi:unnamed protein product, partial [Symbiodinium sp. KB8]